MIRKVIIGDIINLIHRFKEHDVLALASQLAYNLVLAFFPFLIFLMTVIGFSPVNSSDVLAGLNEVLPTDVRQLVKNIIVEVVDTRKGNWLSISLILIIWSASSGFNAVIKGLNKAYNEKEKRSFIKIQLICIFCTLGLTIAIFAIIFFLVFGEVIGNALAVKYGLSGQFKILWTVFRYLVMFFTTIFIFQVLYYFTPSRRITRKEAVPGAIFASITLAIVSMGFAFYVNNFGNYSRVYGSIAAVIVLLTWLFLVSIIIIMGGELNATIAFDRTKRKE